MVRRHEAGGLCEAAYAALTELDNADLIPIRREHHEIETDPPFVTASATGLRRH